MAGQGRKSKKVERAEKKSDNITDALLKDLRKGKHSALALGKVVRVLGDSRFNVKVGDEVQRAHVSKTLHSKGAKHRNATMRFAVHDDSFVLLDGDIIKAVVGAADAAEIRQLTKGENAKAKSTNSNNLFERLGGFFKSRKTRKAPRN